jgi:hypothetical protein
MHAVMMLGSISWDPFIRGMLIVVVAALLLPGSVYLLLATNTGVRVGFLLAAAALFGWLVIMGFVWAVFGIGDPGRVPTWKVSEIITGDISQSTTLTDFPKGFTKLPPGNPELGDATSAADKALAASAAPAAPEGGTVKPPKFPPPFSQPTDYVVVAGFTRDPTTVWHIRQHKITPWGHSKHVDVIQVQPVVPTPDTGGAPIKPQPDTTKPITSLVIVRDLGSVRQPAIVLTGGSLIIFLVICYVLHERDKEIMAARATAGASA